MLFWQGLLLMLDISFIFYSLIILQTVNFIIFITKILQGVEISVSTHVIRVEGGAEAA